MSAKRGRGVKTYPTAGYRCRPSGSPSATPTSAPSTSGLASPSGCTASADTSATSSAHRSGRGGYGMLICRLALDEAQKLGLDRVLLTCADDNVGSWKVIERNGGVLQ